MGHSPSKDWTPFLPVYCLVRNGMMEADGEGGVVLDAQMLRAASGPLAYAAGPPAGAAATWASTALSTASAGIESMDVPPNWWAVRTLRLGV